MPKRRRERLEDAATLLDLDETSSVPLWVQLKKRFVYLIESGYYRPGDQLPTVRGLAGGIDITYNTVSRVYQSLEEDGYVESRRRAGVFVLEACGRANSGIDDAAEALTTEYVARCFELGLGIEEIERQFEAGIRNEKSKREKTQGGPHAQTQASGTAVNVVPFPGAPDSPRRAAGDRA